MKKYEYWLHDGTHGFVYADRYERQDTEYLFYRGWSKVPCYRIPAEWVKDIKETVKA